MKDNPFRFSTKFTDLESGLVNYGFRYYSPALGRFINKDPIQESGGLNLYGFVSNNPVSGVDILGMGDTTRLPDFPVNCDRHTTISVQGGCTTTTVVVTCDDDVTVFVTQSCSGGPDATLYTNLPSSPTAPTSPTPQTPSGPNKSPDKPKPDPRKVECDQARQLAAAVNQNIDDHTAAIGQGLTFGEFLQFQSTRITLGFVGSGITDATRNALSPALGQLVDGIEHDPALSAYRLGTATVLQGWSGLGNFVTGRMFYNTRGADIDGTLPLIMSERFAHEVLYNNLRKFIAACDKEGK
jgi:RHS repeat-associated protein